MNRKKTGKLIFYIGLTIEIIILLIDKSAVTNPIEGNLFRITFLLFAAKIALTEYTINEWAVIAAFLILGIVSYRMTGRNEIIRIVALIASCKEIDIKQTLSYMFKMVLGGCLILILLSLAGILGAVSITGIFRGDVVETRYCLGFGHPNALHCMFFMLVLLGMYLYAAKMRPYHFVILVLMDAGMFLLTGSKTGALACVFAIGLAMLLRFCRRLGEIPLFYVFTAAGLGGCVFIAWWAAKNSEILPYYPEWRKYDRLLSDRIINLYYGSASHAGTLPTWTLWGVPENKYYFDLGWVRLFYWYGVVPALIYIGVLLLLIGTLYRNKDAVGLMVLASLFLYTLVEAHIVSVYLARDYTLFLIGAYWTDMFHANRGKAGYFWQLPKLLKGKAG